MRQVIFGLNSGEFSPDLWGRSDIARYELGAAELRNFDVLYSGAIATRGALRFAEFTQYPDREVRYFSFEFSSSIDQAYLIIFEGGKIRFVRYGAYILEADVAVTGVSSGTVGSTSHGYSDGDLIYIDGYTHILVVDNATTHTYTINDIDGNPVSINLGATNSQRVFTLTHDYADDDLMAVKAYQVFDQIKFTHPSYTPKILTRTASSWTWTEETRGGGVPLNQTPTQTDTGKYIRYIRVTNGGTGYAQSTTITISDGGSGTGAEAIVSVDSTSGAIVGVTIIDGGRNYSSPSATLGATGGGSSATFEFGLSDTEAEYVVAVSAIVDGQETGISRPLVVTGAADFTEAAGSATYSWAPVDDAESYNVYRSTVYPFADRAHAGVQLAFIGNVRGTSLTDNNIQSDATQTPSFYYDPFADGAIISVKVTAAGSGYDHTDTVVVTDASGSGFVGYPIVLAGEIIGIYIANPGSGYVSPSMSITSSGGGSGATFSISLSAADGNNPGVSFIFQQRAGYAGTDNNPMTIWASRSEEFDNFSASDVLDASDPYTYTIDATRISEIRHIIPVQQGLLVFSRDGVTLLRGQDGLAVTPLNGFLDPQSYVGATNVSPVLVGEDLIYVQEKSRGLRMMTFNATARKYEGQEISYLSRHLFAETQVKAIAMSADSNNRGYGVFTNGAGFGVAIQREQQTFAFTSMTTKGLLQDAVRLNVGTEEHIYFAVKRGTRRSIEFIAPEYSSSAEDACRFDGRISVAKNFPAADVEISGGSGTVTVTASASVFSSGDVGKVFWAHGGRGIVASYVSGTEITVTLTREITKLAYEDTEVATAYEGDWWLNPLLSSVSGIPYVGQTVGVVGDGKRMTDKVVAVDGSITLDYPAAIVHVGFPYKARLQTLPPPGTEGKRANLITSHVYYRQIGTMNVGVDGNLFPQTLRTDEPWIEPTFAESAEREVLLPASSLTDDKVVVEIEDGIYGEILRVTNFYEVDDDVGDSDAR